MYKRDARKLARELGLRDGPDVGYGVIAGIGVTLSDVVNGAYLRLLHLYVGVPDGAWPDVETALSRSHPKYGIRSIHADPTGGTIEILFQTSIGLNKRIKAFCETELPRFADLGFPGVARCAFCGKPLADSATKWALAKPDDVALPLHENCFYDFERQIGDNAYKKAAEPGRKVLPVIGALLGGLVGAIPWVILYVFGYFAAIAGFLIGLCANYGHKLLGGKPGKARVFWVIFTIVVIVPVSLAVGELASLAKSILDGSLAASLGYGSDAFVIGDLFPLFRALWESPAARAEMIPTLLKNLVLSYVFAGLGGFWVYTSILRRENKQHRAKIVRL